MRPRGKRSELSPRAGLTRGVARAMQSRECASGPPRLSRTHRSLRGSADSQPLADSGYVSGASVSSKTNDCQRLDARRTAWLRDCGWPTSARDRSLDRLEPDELTGATSRRERGAALLRFWKVRSHFTGGDSAIRDGFPEVAPRDERGERDLPRPLLPPPSHRDGEQIPPIGRQQLRLVRHPGRNQPEPRHGHRRREVPHRTELLRILADRSLQPLIRLWRRIDVDHHGHPRTTKMALRLRVVPRRRSGLEHADTNPGVASDHRACGRRAHGPRLLLRRRPRGRRRRARGRATANEGQTGQQPDDHRGRAEGRDRPAARPSSSLSRILSVDRSFSHTGSGRRATPSLAIRAHFVA